ncbi:MAG: exo-alpha-sialidase, partial [Planctomycetaceae bacterium]|nr:exo-alpha-sialidase [Planctomycetaceae bacterium]
VLQARMKEVRFQRIGWMPRAHPLIRHDGTLILPLSNENFDIPMMALTSDGGETWTYSDPVPAIGMIQPSLVEFPEGRIDAYFRNSDRRQRIKRSTSTDGGLTWSLPELTDRLHPGGGVEVLRLQSGNLALVYNNKEKGPRDKLAISLSTDEGKTWKWTRQLEDTTGGRFDYPSIAQADDGTIHVSYSWELRTIKHAEFNEDWVQQGN